jgi:hypothetical protein
MGDADAVERFSFAFVGRHIDQIAGDEPVAGTRTCAARTRSGLMPKRRIPSFDDPVVGGADRPDICASVAEVGDQRLHLGKDLRFDVRGEVAGGGAAQFVFAKARVNLNHLATDRGLRRLRRAGRAGGGRRSSRWLRARAPRLDRPRHEAEAGIAIPERTIAVEDGDAWRRRKNGATELLSAEPHRRSCL